MCSFMFLCLSVENLSPAATGGRRLEPPRCRRPGVDNAIAKGERVPATTVVYQIDTR